MVDFFLELRFLLILCNGSNQHYFALQLLINVIIKDCNFERICEGFCYCCNNQKIIASLYTSQ